MKKFLGTYLFAILLFVVVIVVFDAVEKIDNFIEYKAPLSEVFNFYVNYVPSLLNQFSGLFTFISVIFFTSKMAYKTEIIAILSSGISFNRLVWPYFLSALLITIGSLVLNLTFIPQANERRIEIENVYVDPKSGDEFEPHLYRRLDEGVFLYLRNYSKNTRAASFFVIEKFNKNTLIGSIEASDVKFDEETKRWKAAKYLEKTFDGDNETFERKEKLDTLINITSDELGHVDQLVESMKIGELTTFIAQQKAKGSDMVQMFEVEKHKRYSYPMSTFILTIIGLSLSSRKVRGGTGLHIGIGVGLCFSYILFARFAEEFAKEGVFPAVISVWIPNLIYSVIALYLYIKAPK